YLTEIRFGQGWNQHLLPALFCYVYPGTLVVSHKYKNARKDARWQKMIEIFTIARRQKHQQAQLPAYARLNFVSQIAHERLVWQIKQLLIAFCGGYYLTFAAATSLGIAEIWQGSASLTSNWQLSSQILNGLLLRL